MIDHLAFPDEATAKADPVVGQYYSADAASWDMSRCIPSIFVWAPERDATRQRACTRPTTRSGTS
jgi:hypothetical protein